MTPNKLIIINILLFFSLTLSIYSFAQTKIKEKIEPTQPQELQTKPILTSDIPLKPTVKDISDIARGKSPKEIAKLFFALDLSGDRITNSTEQILKLTNWTKPLPWDIYVVVDKWGIKSEKIKEDRAVVEAQFELIGRVVKNEYLLKEPQTEELELLFELNKKKNQWEIVSEQFPPHVARSNIPSNIKELSIYTDQSRPQKESGGAGAHQ